MIALVFYDLLYRRNASKMLVRIIISYIELLRSMQLFSEATHVIKVSSKIQEVSKQFQEKDFNFTLMCQFCRMREEQPMGSKCVNPKCKQVLARCSVCQLPVEGRYIWCQTCNHGGHQTHMANWFQFSKFCPAGCGHQCH